MDKIEKHIMAVYKDIQKQLPKVHNLTFTATTHDTGESKLYGFLHKDEHTDEDCEYFNSVSELKNIIQKEVEKQRIRKILHRNFKGIL